MRILTFMALVYAGGLLLLSIILPPMPLWAGGLAGTILFCLTGGLSARLIDRKQIYK